MIFLRLFLEFVKVGLFTFGGAYGSIPIIRETVLSNAWMSDDLFTYILGVSESTPGPIMVNTATYVGNTVGMQATGTVWGGFFGSVCATLGVVTPSFIIILLIAALLRRFMEKKPVRAVLDGVKPCIVGIILITAIHLFAACLFPGLANSFRLSGLDTRALIMILLIGAGRSGWKMWKKRAASPILTILAAAVLGVAVYGV
ncbi:MAG: chromate transporter [Clostridia bacterium]|nr:chromate transporter [Clostridia bacterium]